MFFVIAFFLIFGFVPILVVSFSVLSFHTVIHLCPLASCIFSVVPFSCLCINQRFLFIFSIHNKRILTGNSEEFSYKWVYTTKRIE